MVAAVADVKAWRCCVGVGGVVSAVKRPLCVFVGERRGAVVELVLMLVGMRVRACIASRRRSAERESGWH